MAGRQHLDPEVLPRREFQRREGAAVFVELVAGEDEARPHEQEGLGEVTRHLALGRTELGSVDVSYPNHDVVNDLPAEVQLDGEGVTVVNGDDDCGNGPLVRHGPNYRVRKSVQRVALILPSSHWPAFSRTFDHE